MRTLHLLAISVLALILACPARADDTAVFSQRPIPDGVPLSEPLKNSKLYGYRIPSLLVTREGTILAFAERRIGLGDHAENDIVLRRSEDGGKSFGEDVVVFEDGPNSLNDPLSVQLEDGRILLMFARFPHGRHTRAHGWVKKAEPGYTDRKLHVLTFLTASADDGRTWSDPVDITRQVKPESFLNANTPGSMIQLKHGLRKGRIVTGLWGCLAKPGPDGSRQFGIVAAYSDDGGTNWQHTDPLTDNTGKGFPNECQVAEATNGDIVLISRNQAGATFRKKAVSKDGGTTWSEIEIDRGLPSVACMGAVISEPASGHLIASFPCDKGRRDGQIAVSRDHGNTWSIPKIIPGGFAYSALQTAPGGKDLLLFHETAGYKTITLKRIPLAELDPSG